MRYSTKEKLEIGRRVYDGEITRYRAAEEYGVSEATIRNFMRLYRDTNNLQPKFRNGTSQPNNQIPQISVSDNPGMEEYMSMTKEQLITELIRSRIREERLKKGYEVKGDGPDKVYIVYDNKNIK